MQVAIALPNTSSNSITYLLPDDYTERQHRLKYLARDITTPGTGYVHPGLQILGHRQLSPQVHSTSD